MQTFIPSKIKVQVAGCRYFKIVVWPVCFRVLSSVQNKTEMQSCEQGIRFTHICYINLYYHTCITKISTLFHSKPSVGIFFTIFTKPYIEFLFQVLWVCITSAWKVGRVLRVAASSWTLWRFDTMLFWGCNGRGMVLLHILKYLSKLLPFHCYKFYLTKGMPKILSSLHIDKNHKKFANWMLHWEYWS